MTDESASYNPVIRPHATVCHSQKESVRDDDGDGIREVHVNTVEGMWTDVRNFLRSFKGVHKDYLSSYIAVFEFNRNLKRINSALIASLVNLHTSCNRSRPHYCNRVDDPITTPANWRESWHPANVQVWGRIADRADDSEAIEWLHGKAYSSDYDARGHPIPRQIKRTSITGGDINRSLNIGRLWHRMYPVVLKQPDPHQPDRSLPNPTSRYLELLALFPDHTDEFDRFIRYLTREQEEFQLLWGDSTLESSPLTVTI